MKCKFCGYELPDSALFCANCGKNLAEEAAEEAVEEQTQIFSTEPTEEETTAEKIVKEEIVAEENEADKSEAKDMPTAQPAIVAASDMTVGKKPKNKLPLFIGLGAAALLIIVFALLFIFNTAGMMKLFMGKEDYGKYIITKGISDINSGISDEAALNALSEVISIGNADINSNSDVSLATLEMINAALGSEGLSISAGLNINPTEEIYDIPELARIDEDVLADAIKEFNTYSITAAERITSDSLEFALKFGGKKKSLLNIGINYNNESDAYLTFPDISKKAVLVDETGISLPEKSEPVTIDKKQLKNLSSQLSVILDKYLDKADIKVSDDKLKVKNASFEGICVKVKLELSDIMDMKDDMLEAMDDDKYFTDLIEELIGNDFDFGDYVKSVKSDGNDEEVDIEISLFVTSQNKIKGIELELSDDRNSMALSALDTSEAFAAVFEYLGTELVALQVEKESLTKGTAAISWILDNREEVEVDVAYSNLGLAKALGRTIVTGDFRMTLGSSALQLFGSELYSLGNMLGVDDIIDDIVKKSAFDIKISKSGKGIRTEVAIDNEDLGYYGAYAVLEPVSKSIAEGIFKEKLIVEAEDMDNDTGIEFLSEIVEYYDGIIFEGTIIGDLLDEALDIDDVEELLEYVIGEDDVEEIASAIAEAASA